MKSATKHYNKESAANKKISMQKLQDKIIMSENYAKKIYDKLIPDDYKFPWDGLNIVRLCADMGSVRKAASTLQVDPTTISRRISQLEGSLGLTIFERHNNGLNLTTHGKRVLRHAQEMQTIAESLKRYAIGQKSQSTKTIRISTTQGNGSFWLMPHLIKFEQLHPEINLSLNCSMKDWASADPEYDICIHHGETPNKNFKQEQIGWVHIYPFARKGYFSIQSKPKTPQELAEHRLIKEIGCFSGNFDMLKILCIDESENKSGVETTNLPSSLNAIEQGAGIGFLPSYFSLIKDNLESIDIGLNLSRGIWVSINKSIQNTEFTELILNWLREIYNPASYPCFDKTAILPEKLVELDDWSGIFN